MIIIELFKLFGSILVDSNEADKSISKTEKNADGLGKKLGEGIKTAAKWGAAIGAGALAAGAAMFAMAGKSAEATDRIDKLSQRLGISRQAFQEWDFILSQNGVSMDSMQTAMKSMTASMASLADEGKKGKETLGKLGITVEDLKNLKQEEIFEKAVIALQNMDEGYEKARLAQQLFGKQGQEMLPMLNQSKGSIEELKNKAHELGLVLGDDAIDAGVKYADTMDSIKRTIGAVTTQLGVGMMPILQKFLDWILLNMPGIQAVAEKVFSMIGKMVGKVAEIFGSITDNELPSFTDKIKEIYEKIMPSMQKIFKVITEDVIPAFSKIFKTIAETAIPLVADAFKFITEKIMPPVIKIIEFLYTEIVPKMAKAFAEWMPVIMDIMKGLWEIIKLVLDDILKKWDIVWPYLKTVLIYIWDSIENVITVAINVIKGIIDVVLGVITGDWDRAWNGIKDIITSIWDGIKKNVENSVNFVKNIIDNMMGTISKAIDFINVFNNKKVESKDVTTSNKVKIDGARAKGGRTLAGKAYLVGEEGPEIFTSDSNGKIIPNDKIGSSSGTVSNNFSIQNMNVRNDNDIKLIARELYHLQKQSARGRGVSLA